MNSPLHPTGAALIQQTLAAVAADTALREAEALHGPVTQVWFHPFTVRDRYALGHWHRLVLADGSVLRDSAFAHRRTTPAHWWETLMQSAREFCAEQDLGYEALVVHAATGGEPARLETTSAELPQPTVSNICTRGPITSRLTQMVVELHTIEAALAPGAQYDLADALLVLQTAIDQGEPALTGPLPGP
ncbi:hypothetical protein [Streptomyces sp. MMBL 11-1]|uniref:hypothetical protein n=1 Tax=Streptomyces sp. MMBL 11-1 TaxID=3026420 RepID=UPI002361F599|nr:hypothetical protein [Streptomyces sp. MMBL 11-1]